MSTEHRPIEHEPRCVRPPYEVRDDSLDHIRSDKAWRLAVQSDREAALREPLAGLPLTGYECRQLRWLAGHEIGPVAVIAGLLQRARAAAPLAPT
jgi:hypothetical protein